MTLTIFLAMLHAMRQLRVSRHDKEAAQVVLKSILAILQVIFRPASALIYGQRYSHNDFSCASACFTLESTNAF